MSSLDNRQLRALASARQRPLPARLGTISPDLKSRLLSLENKRISFLDKSESKASRKKYYISCCN